MQNALQSRSAVPGRPLNAMHFLQGSCMESHTFSKACEMEVRGHCIRNLVHVIAHWEFQVWGSLWPLLASPFPAHVVTRAGLAFRAPLVVSRSSARPVAAPLRDRGSEQWKPWVATGLPGKVQQELDPEGIQQDCVCALTVM